MKFFVLCALLAACTLAQNCNISRNGRCGTSHNSTYCTPGAFCSRYGWCGIGSAWSAHSAQSRFDGTAACVVAQQKPATRVVVITNKQSHKVLDVNRGRFRSGTNLIQWSNHNGENQRFQMVYLNAHEFQLIPMQGQELIAQKSGNMDVKLEARDDTPDAIFHQDGERIKNQHGDCLAIRAGSNRNGAHVVLTPNCVDHDDQKWTITNHTSRRLQHCNISRNGRCGTSHNNTYCTPGAFCSRYGWCGIGSAWSAHSSQSRFDGTAACVVAQQKPATRVVVVTNKQSHKVLDVNRGRFRSGTNLIQWSNHNGENQRFEMVYLSAHEFQLIPMRGQELIAQKSSNMDVKLEARDDSADAIFHQDGEYIKNQHGDCLAIRAGSNRNGAHVVLTPNCVDHDDQKWTITNHSSSRRRLQK